MMTAHETSVITQLVREMGELVGSFREHVKAEDEWQARTDAKLDAVVERLTDMPCVMDKKIDACRVEREAVTAPAVRAATRRDALGGLLTDARIWTGAVIGTAGVVFGVLYR